MVNKIPSYTISNDGRYAIVSSRSHPASSQIMAVSCRETLESCGVDGDSIYLIDCPSDLLLPGVCREVADTGYFRAVAALAVVPRTSGAYRSVQIGMVTSEFSVPVIPVVVREGGDESAMAKAGADAGRSAVELSNLGEMLGELVLASSAELFGNPEESTEDGEGEAPQAVRVSRARTSGTSPKQTKRKGRQASKPAQRRGGAKRRGQ
jgi:6,7-dimethyl-8-ribityllumazine synthase